jgi:protein-S-isoprenylcysteine O-methyltransferase Ste14
MTNPGDGPGIRVIWIRAGGIILICASFLLSGLAISRFRRASTPLDVRKPSKALITEGPYRYSRNPQYLALTFLYLGLAFLTECIWALVLLVPALAVMTYGVVRKEEAHLERQFGDEYRKYKSRVHRWL